MDRDEILSLVASKKTILSAPGTKLSSLYYNVMNASVDAVEITYNTGRFQTSLSSLHSDRNLKLFSLILRL